jgi:ATP-dependent DNA helicase RecG
LSKTVANNIGKKAEYTRKKGLDDDFYRKLLLDFVKEYRQVNRKEVNELLMEKLPDSMTDKQKLTKIGHLLTALRVANQIKLGEKKLWIYIEH